MARDIEEFLRRAAERRKQQQQRQRTPPPSQRVRQMVEQADVEVVAGDVEVVAPKRKRRQPAKPNLRDESVQDHVKRHIDTSDITEHAIHLGERIQHADERLTSRLKRKFDHDVSKLDDRPTVQDDVVASVKQEEISRFAQDLVDMLRSPRSIRQAVLIGEIFNRPNFD